MGVPVVRIQRSEFAQRILLLRPRKCRSELKSPRPTPKEAAVFAATSGPKAPAVPAAEQSVAVAWGKWEKTVAAPMVAKEGVDTAPSSMTGRYDFYTATNWNRPFPGDTTILDPAQVPGRYAYTVDSDH